MNYCKNSFVGIKHRNDAFPNTFFLILMIEWKRNIMIYYIIIFIYAYYPLLYYIYIYVYNICF